MKFNPDAAYAVKTELDALLDQCEEAVQNLNRFARCTIGEPTPEDCEWAREWLKRQVENV